MLDHPVTQKFLLAVATAAFAGAGGTIWTAHATGARHEVQLEAIMATDSRIQDELVAELKEIRKVVTEIKTDVAIVRTRTDKLEDQADELRDAHARDR